MLQMFFSSKLKRYRHVILCVLAFHNNFIGTEAQNKLYTDDVIYKTTWYTCCSRQLSSWWSANNPWICKDTKKLICRLLCPASLVDSWTRGRSLNSLPGWRSYTSPRLIKKYQWDNESWCLDCIESMYQKNQKTIRSLLVCFSCT